eukprot:4102808-Pyramimonas_sp.AAC.1
MFTCKIGAAGARPTWAGGARSPESHPMPLSTAAGQDYVPPGPQPWQPDPQQALVGLKDYWALNENAHAPPRGATIVPIPMLGLVTHVVTMLKLAKDPSVEFRLRVDLNLTVRGLKEQIVQELDADFTVCALSDRSRLGCHDHSQTQTVKWCSAIKHSMRRSYAYEFPLKRKTTRSDGLLGAVFL